MVSWVVTGAALVSLTQGQPLGLVGVDLEVWRCLLGGDGAGHKGSSWGLLVDLEVWRGLLGGDGAGHKGSSRRTNADPTSRALKVPL